jgi:Ni/Co efflux regulator RcnB
MKLKPSLGKYALITLLTAGLLSTPLLANAGKGNHERHGHQKHEQYTQLRQHQHSYKYCYARGHHDPGHHQNHGRHYGHYKHFNHGHTGSHRYYRPHEYRNHHGGHDSHHARVKKYKVDTQQYDHPLFFLGWFSND